MRKHERLDDLDSRYSDGTEQDDLGGNLDTLDELNKRESSNLIFCIILLCYMINV